MEIKRIDGYLIINRIGPESPYTIRCSRRELRKIYEKGLDNIEVKRVDDHLIIDQDADKPYVIIFSSEGELESLKDGLCCDGADELRQLIRKELSSIKRINILGKR